MDNTTIPIKSKGRRCCYLFQCKRVCCILQSNSLWFAAVLRACSYFAECSTKFSMLKAVQRISETIVQKNVVPNTFCEKHSKVSHAPKMGHKLNLRFCFSQKSSAKLCCETSCQESEQHWKTRLWPEFEPLNSFCCVSTRVSETSLVSETIIYTRKLVKRNELQMPF